MYLTSTDVSMSMFRNTGYSLHVERPKAATGVKSAKWFMGVSFYHEGHSSSADFFYFCRQKWWILVHLYAVFDIKWRHCLHIVWEFLSRDYGLIWNTSFSILRNSLVTLMAEVMTVVSHCMLASDLGFCEEGPSRKGIHSFFLLFFLPYPVSFLFQLSTFSTPWLPLYHHEAGRGHKPFLRLWHQHIPRVVKTSVISLSFFSRI